MKNRNVIELLEIAKMQVSIKTAGVFIDQALAALESEPKSNRQKAKESLEEAARDFYYIHQHSEDAHTDSYKFMGKVEQALVNLGSEPKCILCNYTGYKPPYRFGGVAIPCDCQKPEVCEICEGSGKKISGVKNTPSGTAIEFTYIPCPCQKPEPVERPNPRCTCRDVRNPSSTCPVHAQPKMLPPQNSKPVEPSDGYPDYLRRCAKFMKEHNIDEILKRNAYELEKSADFIHHQAAIIKSQSEEIKDLKT